MYICFRLVNTSENLLNISNIPAHKVPNKCVNKEFISAKKLFKKSTFHTGIFVGQKMTPISNTVIERLKVGYNNNNNSNNNVCFVLKIISVV